MNEPYLAIRNLTKSYRDSGFGRKRRVRTVLQVDELTVRRGECLALVGESGSGKTTLGRCLLRLVEPDAGAVAYRGTDVLALPEKVFRKWRPKLQMVFQNPALALNPRQTVRACLAEPLRVHFRLHGASLESRLRELLAEVQLGPAYLMRYPHELSGGQMQRVAIARALACEPEFLVADEPTSSLDAIHKNEIIGLIRSLQTRRGLTVLWITHDLRAASTIAGRIAVLLGGRIVEFGEAASVLAQPGHPYTHTLLQAAAWFEEGAGDGPSETHDCNTVRMPELSCGCVYASRCPAIRPACRRQPVPVAVALDHTVACNFPGALAVRSDAAQRENEPIDPQEREQTHVQVCQPAAATGRRNRLGRAQSDLSFRASGPR